MRDLTDFHEVTMYFDLYQHYTCTRKLFAMPIHGYCLTKHAQDNHQYILLVGANLPIYDSLECKTNRQAHITRILSPVSALAGHVPWLPPCLGPNGLAAQSDHQLSTRSKEGKDSKY